MKWILLFSIWMTSNACASDASSESPWDFLEKGFGVLAVTNTGQKVGITRDQERLAIVAGCYYKGFMDGLNYSGYVEIEENASPLLFPDSKLYSLEIAAPKILSFINANKGSIDPKGPNAFLMGWYLSTHPKSTEKQKMTGLALLKATKPLKF